MQALQLAKTIALAGRLGFFKRGLGLLESWARNIEEFQFISDHEHNIEHMNILSICLL